MERSKAEYLYLSMFNIMILVGMIATYILYIVQEISRGVAITLIVVFLIMVIIRYVCSAIILNELEEEKEDEPVQREV